MASIIERDAQAMADGGVYVVIVATDDATQFIARRDRLPRAYTRDSQTRALVEGLPYHMVLAHAAEFHAMQIEGRA